MASTDVSAETRARILETAWERAREQGVASLSVKDIAADAGVSRQLIYFHYGNRAGLLRAMARHQDRGSEFAQAVLGAGELPAVEALESLVRSWCAYVGEILPVSRALEAALITGDEGGEAWQDRMGQLHEVFGEVLSRVAAERRLRSEWTAEAATDWAWAQLQVAQWDYLVEMRGWSPNDYVERMTRSILEQLID